MAELPSSQALDQVLWYDRDKLSPQARRLIELFAFVGPTMSERFMRELAADTLTDEPAFDDGIFDEALDELLRKPLVVRDSSGLQLTIVEKLQNKVLLTLERGEKLRLFDGVLRKTASEWPSMFYEASTPSQDSEDGMSTPSQDSEAETEILDPPPPTWAAVLAERSLLPRDVVPNTEPPHQSVSQWPARDALSPTIFRLDRVLVDFSSSSDETIILLAKLVAEAAWHRKSRGYLTLCFSALSKHLAYIACVSTESDHYRAAVAARAGLHLSLGSVNLAWSDFDHVERHIGSAFRRLEYDDARVSVVFAERGAARIQAEQYEDGIFYLQESIRFSTRRRRGHVPDSREANIAWAMMAQERLVDADVLLRESLEAREKAFGECDADSFEKGLLLNAVAGLRARQENMGESYIYQQRAWIHMRDTIGADEPHPYMAKMAHKMAEHLFHRRQIEDARTFISRARDGWRMDLMGYERYAARTMFLEGQILALQGWATSAANAKKRATSEYNYFTNQEWKVNELSLADFDRLVVFWAR